MKALFVPGIKSYPFYHWGWKKDFMNHPEITDFKVRNDFYIYFQFKKCRTIVDSIKQDILTLKPDIVIAHSFGGILAKTAIAELENHSVQLFCSMSSPHKMKYHFVQKCMKFLGTPLELTNVPHLLSYGGTLDPIVFKHQSILPNATHKDLPVEHMAFLLSKTIRKQVLDDCLKTIIKL